MTMRTLRLALAAAPLGLAAALLVPAAGHGAVCTTQLTKGYVAGNGRVISLGVERNVAPAQRFVQRCSIARQVVRQAARNYFYRPVLRNFPAFGFATQGTPAKGNPELRSYVATFRGADTNTFAQIRFQIPFIAAGGFRPASTPDAEFMISSISDSGVGGIASVPKDWYSITQLRISNANPAYGSANLTPRPAFVNRLQSTPVLVKRLGSTWQVIDVDEINCGVAPRPVLESLFGGCVPGP
jgi:hypothetical protein